MGPLFALLTYVPPGLRGFLLFPAAMVFCFTLLMPFAGALEVRGVSGFVLAFVLAASFGVGRLALSQLGDEAAPVRVGGSAFLMVAGLLVVLLAVHDPLWCQRSITVAFLLKAALMAPSVFAGNGDMGKFGGPGTEHPGFARAWGQWRLVALLMLVLINEAAIRYGTLVEWMVVWSVAPVVIYCLFYWTLMATWEDPPESD